MFLMGACGSNVTAPAEDEVKAALSELSDQYVRRVMTSQELIRMVKTISRKAKFEIEPLQTACAQASSIKTADVLNSRTGFEKNEVAQARMADLLSRLLVELDADRRLRLDPEFGLLKAKLSNEERWIGIARNRYNEAARMYNEKLLAFPRDRFSDFMRFTPKPLLAIPDKTLRAPPRRDFGALRGGLRV